MEKIKRILYSYNLSQWIEIEIRSSDLKYDVVVFFNRIEYSVITVHLFT